MYDQYGDLRKILVILSYSLQYLYIKIYSQYLEGAGFPRAGDSLTQGKPVNSRLVLPTVEAIAHQVAVAARNPEVQRRQPKVL